MAESPTKLTDQKDDPQLRAMIDYLSRQNSPDHLLFAVSEAIRILRTKALIDVNWSHRPSNVNAHRIAGIYSFRSGWAYTEGTEEIGVAESVANLRELSVDESVSMRTALCDGAAVIVLIAGTETLVGCMVLNATSLQNVVK
jgi:hypothetical protein